MSAPVSKLALAMAHWGDPPDWVRALAVACDGETQAAVASRVGYSASVVSTVIKRTYPGNWRAVEDKVRGALMGAIIDCPSLGGLPLNECREWRVRSRKLSTANPMRVRMFRACMHCVHNRKPEGSSG